MSAATRPGGRRGGLPLSIKLILTTSFVVSGAVFASAIFSQRAIEDLAKHDADNRRAEGLAAIESESALLARNVATAVSIPLGQSALADVPPLLESAVRDYPRIRWLIVVDPTEQVVAKVGEPSKDEAEARFEKEYRAEVRLGAQRLGEVRLGVSTAELEAALAASLADAAERARAARRKMLLGAVLLLAGGIALAALQGISMARPLRLLAEQAERIAGGDLERRVPEDRGDEIGHLARNFNFMAGRLGQLVIESAEKASLEREMSLARGVQQAMLPSEDLIVHGGVRIAGHCVPASSCGGDWWTYRKMSGGRTLIVIGDATGHGLHSALIAATARGAVEALADADERLISPEQVLNGIHAAISGIGEHSLLMTCFAAVVDPEASTVHYANAGQNFPYVLRRSAKGSLDDAQIIAVSGNPLGDPRIPQLVRRGSRPLNPGDVLVVFTDGVVERQNPLGKLFGDRRLRTVFHGKKVDAEAQLLALREEVVRSVESFASGTTAQDDITFVLVQSVPAQGRTVRTAS